jgi:hypothetical protein
MQRFLVREGKIGQVGRNLARVLPPLGAWTAARDLRPLEAKSFRERWQSELIP